MLTYADAAQEAGRSHGKWPLYEKACRLLALEVADHYAMLAINSAGKRMLTYADVC